MGLMYSLQKRGFHGSVNFRYGICYAFNFVNTSQSGQLESISSGEDFGLSLTLNVEESAYMRYGLSPSTGIYVIISEPRKIPEVISSKYKIGERIWFPPLVELVIRVNTQNLKRV